MNFSKNSLSEKLKQSYTPRIDKILLGLLTNATKELVLGTYIFGETNFQRMTFLYNHKHAGNEFKTLKKLAPDAKIDANFNPDML
ncbi:hypothetical protein [Leuconostoc gasicomitatum]|uniref:hypothetical protein n=1 Tax=Leuconostoc gasicomitatum TaxID=115778 RepID=UPI001CC718CB|nr:hypothetical protein [Leuconostoc gasicomitatum]